MAMLKLWILENEGVLRYRNDTHFKIISTS